MKLNHFNFKYYKDKVLITNDFGKFMFLNNDEFKNLVSKSVDLESECGKKLLENKFIYCDADVEFTSYNKHLLREAKSYLNVSTALHIFVITTACNMNCVYCQANNGIDHRPLIMTKEIAEKSVDIALASPKNSLSFEFQGGEPLLNFDVLKHIVEYAEKNRGAKQIEYSVVTNLTLLTDEIIEFFKLYNISVSTSLDGDEGVHDKNRPFINGTGTFDTVCKAIQKLQSRGVSVGAIQTTTKESLKHPREIINAYKELGFNSVFIRPLTQLGKANLNWENYGYSAEEFLRFYAECFDEIIRINKDGCYFRESHAAIFLRKMAGEGVNYMELRSPCGAGIGQMAYYSDGNVFTCDEGRMLYEMGNDAFLLGNVNTDSYESLIKNSICKTVCQASMLETIPSCCDCAYQPYCGTCPVVNYALSEDVIEKSPRGYRCSVYKGMIEKILDLYYKEDLSSINIINSWR